MKRKKDQAAGLLEEGGRVLFALGKKRDPGTV